MSKKWTDYPEMQPQSFEQRTRRTKIDRTVNRISFAATGSVIGWFVGIHPELRNLSSDPNTVPIACAIALGLICLWSFSEIFEHHIS